MSVKIRLSRRGAKKRPFYWIVAAESRAPRDGRFLEKLGTYNPMLPREAEGRVRLEAERVREWLGRGARPSDRVARMLHEAGLMPAPARPAQTKKSEPKAKAQERAKAAAEAKAALKTAEEEAAAAPAPAEEAPAQEEATEEAKAKEKEGADEAGPEEQESAGEEAKEGAAEEKEPAEGASSEEPKEQKDGEDKQGA